MLVRICCVYISYSYSKLLEARVEPLCFSLCVYTYKHTYIRTYILVCVVCICKLLEACVGPLRFSPPRSLSLSLAPFLAPFPPFSLPFSLPFCLPFSLLFSLPCSLPYPSLSLFFSLSPPPVCVCVCVCVCTGLLTREPERRLGKGGALEVKSHPFFQARTPQTQINVKLDP